MMKDWIKEKISGKSLATIVILLMLSLAGTGKVHAQLSLTRTVHAHVPLEAGQTLNWNLNLPGPLDALPQIAPSSTTGDLYLTVLNPWPGILPTSLNLGTVEIMEEEVVVTTLYVRLTAGGGIVDVVISDI